MFSSFKEKLNTSISTLQEKSLSSTLSTTHAKVGSGTTPGLDAVAGAGTPGAPRQTETLEVHSGTPNAVTPAGVESRDVVTPVNTADLSSLASPHSPTPSVLLQQQQQHHHPQPQPQPQPSHQGSFGSIASRISSGASSSSLFFRRPLQATRSTADLMAVGTSTPSSSPILSTGSHQFLDPTSGVASPNRLAILVQKLTLDPQEEMADPAELDKIRNFYNQQEQEQRQQQQRQPSGTELSTVVIEKLEILRRYEARFPDLADAFKQIVREKIAAEAVLKASTPLEDLGDVDALEAHLQNMTSKNEMSMQEIRRLSEELRETIKKKDEESASQMALIENLRTQLLEFEPNAKSRSFMDIDIDIDTKVNTSLDLSAEAPPSAPTTPPPQTDDLPSTVSSTPLAPSTPPPSKSKKSKDPEKKNQALRELMIRLEAVLKEKNQAQEDQEEAVEQVRQLQSRLDEEIQVNKDISVELEHMRATVTELKENRPRIDDSAESVESGSTLVSEELIQAARLETEAVLMAKKVLEVKLSTVQKEHTVLLESMSQTERTLETAKNQIRELGDLSKQLRTAKMELDDTQEELQEKQRLLDLERSWREEAEASRDAMKRDHDAAVKNSRQVQNEAEERVKALESRVEQVILATTTESSQMVTQLQITISELEKRIAQLNGERAELAYTLSERPDRASEILVLNSRIAQLEQESQDGQQQTAVLTSESKSSNGDRDPSSGATIQTLHDKIVQMEAELETRNQTPSLNDLKKLHDDLSAAKQAQVDADETIAALQAEIKSAAAASEAVKESDATISLEELSSLKQERAELSEKLTRLERLHQGFERSSSERIQTLEQELAVLLKQKAALEAQVQEQSDLLIREKEKEKEMEQARVAEGIDRVTLELAAVRTAERFASSKVTELAKERDLVAEKVVKLEKHLEKLRECKVGQEQSLTGQIQELTVDKEALEKQVGILQLELEQAKAQLEESKNEQTEKEDKVSEERNRAIARVTELEVELRNMSEESDLAQSARQQQNKDKDQVASLTLELKTKSKKLAIAQEQAQVQRTMHADKISQLSSQILALRTERDSLSQPKVELESLLAEMTDKAESLGQQVKVMEEDTEPVSRLRHQRSSNERDQFLKERDQLVQDKDVGQMELERKQAELETLKRMHESAEKQMQEYHGQLSEARNRVDTLEELTSIAKRVAETKVAELEQLKVKSAEAEHEFTRVKSQLRTKDEEYRAQREKFKAEVEETRQVLGNEIAELTELLEKNNLDVIALRELIVQQGEELNGAKSRLEEQECLVKTLKQESQEVSVRKHDLELELQHFKDLEEIIAKDRTEYATTIEDYKMREGHLRTANKTLKEEVRKLQKLNPSSPLPSPTSPHSPYSSQSNHIPSTPTPATPRPRGSGGGGVPHALPRAATMALPVSPRWSPSHAQAAGDDDVNVEYLKNVLLNFMEHKERRQQLIPVVAQMLRLSSDETKRFSKVV
ncbi:hypothetical protein BGZ95_004729 [Linnemannia exigua]|uniref:GRIP domain-containing protein n=1 Tax=Linnemannia exigua TaxID=604196 RepID=A0AAD4DH69_9FUNG|nr:hypothetical protein BGZ95_004729 [Linnemannia exigua]